MQNAPFPNHFEHAYDRKDSARIGHKVIYIRGRTLSARMVIADEALIEHPEVGDWYRQIVREAAGKPPQLFAGLDVAVANSVFPTNIVADGFGHDSQPSHAHTALEARDTVMFPSCGPSCLPCWQASAA